MDYVGEVTEMILEAKRIVFLTGAGISTESGIPDFRSPGGIWDRFDPSQFTYQKFLSSEESRKQFWDFYQWLWLRLADAKPNRGHQAIAELYDMGKLDCVITQTVDNLHQESGIPEDRVIELHGTLRWVVCLECSHRYPKEEIQRRLELGERLLRCEGCRGLIKPATLTFGQPMPQIMTDEARKRAADCDLFMIAGSSLIDYPVAQIPYIAKSGGARLVMVNLSSTPHDPYIDVVIHEKIGKALPQIVRQVKSRLKRSRVFH